MPLALPPRERLTVKYKMRRLHASFSAILAAALSSAPLAASAGDRSGQEIRIGVAGPLTTPSATFGLEMRRAPRATTRPP